MQQCRCFGFSHLTGESEGSKPNNLFYCLFARLAKRLRTMAVGLSTAWFSSSWTGGWAAWFSSSWTGGWTAWFSSSWTGGWTAWFSSSWTAWFSSSWTGGSWSFAGCWISLSASKSAVKQSY